MPIMASIAASLSLSRTYTKHIDDFYELYGSILILIWNGIHKVGYDGFRIAM